MLAGSPLAGGNNDSFPPEHNNRVIGERETLHISIYI